MKNKITMKRYPVFFFAVLLGLITACGPANPPGEQAGTDESEAAPIEVSPSILFENDYARVAQVRLEPGEALADHDGMVRLIYSLGDYRINWTEQGRDEGEKTWSAGDVHRHDAGQHAARNVGDTPAEWLVFNRKENALPTCAQTEKPTLDELAVDGVQLRFDDDRFRLFEVTLPPQGKLPMHAGINRLIYALADNTIRYQEEGAEPVEKTLKAGEVHWHDGCNHALENLGETDARFLVVAFKK
jgi:quercetin dioxygenase-like cupin family protein